MWILICLRLASCIRKQFLCIASGCLCARQIRFWSWRRWSWSCCTASCRGNDGNIWEPRLSQGELSPNSTIKMGTFRNSQKVSLGNLTSRQMWACFQTACSCLEQGRKFSGVLKLFLSATVSGHERIYMFFSTDWMFQFSVYSLQDAWIETAKTTGKEKKHTSMNLVNKSMITLSDWTRKE